VGSAPRSSLPGPGALLQATACGGVARSWQRLSVWSRSGNGAWCDREGLLWPPAGPRLAATRALPRWCLSFPAGPGASNPAVASNQRALRVYQTCARGRTRPLGWEEPSPRMQEQVWGPPTPTGASVFCANREAHRHLRWRNLCPASLLDCSEEQTGKPFEEPELPSRSALGSSCSSTTY
jgi:hypothetical protein